MTYQETIDWMFSKLPIFQKIGKQAFKVDLTNIKLICKHLGNPQNKIKTVHVGGTNGKGSTSSIIASVLQEAGYKVGLFTSPHLKDFRERIKINGTFINEQNVIYFINENKRFFELNEFSFFEITFALALKYFADLNVDVAIIEVGLGGRLDSTNIISPLLSVITNIGLDHQNILGNTKTEIAKEKAGIIKENTPIVIGSYSKKTKSIFTEKANQVNSPIWFVEDINTVPKFSSDLQGSYQKQNKKTAYIALNILKNNFTITQQHIEDGMNKVVINTKLQGRWQVLNNEPKIIADTAHNLMGLKKVFKQIKKQKYKKLHIVFGMVADKDYDKIISLLPKKAYYYLCKPNVVRGLDTTELANSFNLQKLDYKILNTVSDAYLEAQKKASAKDLIYVGGSTFVVAEIL